MNTSELRIKTRELAAKAKGATGNPGPDDIARAHEIFEVRKSVLSDQISSNVQVKYSAEPDWSSWLAIEEFCSACYIALVDLDNKLLTVLNEGRPEGI